MTRNYSPIKMGDTTRGLRDIASDDDQHDVIIRIHALFLIPTATGNVASLRSLLGSGQRSASMDRDISGVGTHVAARSMDIPRDPASTLQKKP